MQTFDVCKPAFLLSKVLVANSVFSVLPAHSQARDGTIEGHKMTVEVTLSPSHSSGAIESPSECSGEVMEGVKVNGKEKGYMDGEDSVIYSACERCYAAKIKCSCERPCRACKKVNAVSIRKEFIHLLIRNRRTEVQAHLLICIRYV